MIRKISKYLLKLLKKKCPIPPNEQDIYEYGIDVLLYTVLSTTGLLFLRLLYGQFTESIVIIAILYLNQTLGGGFHASTHLNCFATMAIGLSCCLSTLFVHPISFAGQRDDCLNVCGFHAAISLSIACTQSIPVQQAPVVFQPFTASVNLPATGLLLVRNM